MLEKLGLDAEAGAVDKEMLKDPQSRPGDIALRLGWEGARVRSALDELAWLALMRPSWQEPGVLKPVDPEESRMGALVLRGRGVVSALCELFERVRQSSLPVTSEPEAPLGREKPAPRGMASCTSGTELRVIEPHPPRLMGLRV
jgi:hypothetical protein